MRSPTLSQLSAKMSGAKAFNLVTTSDKLLDGFALDDIVNKLLNRGTAERRAERVDKSI